MNILPGIEIQLARDVNKFACWKKKNSYSSRPTVVPDAVPDAVPTAVSTAVSTAVPGTNIVTRIYASESEAFIDVSDIDET